MTETNVKKSKKKKIILRTVLFIVIAALLFVYLNEVFTISNSDSNKCIFNAFYAEEDNTIDGVYLGTSASNRYFIGPKAYNETGMTVFTLATMGMPLFFVPNLIEEVEKTQDPSLYIIELRWVLKDKNMITDAHIRRVTDSMKYSVNRLNAVNKALEFTKGAEGELSNIDTGFWDYYIPIVKYHSRLETGDITYKDVLLTNSKNKTKGYVTSAKTLEQVPQEEAVYSESRGELSSEAQAALVDLLNYCDSIDKDVLFVMSPYSVKEGQAERFNKAIDIVTDRGYEVINFNTPEMIEELGINRETDFYNSKHVNYLGAEKYTTYFTEYIAENYDLKDHRGDKKYESWNEAYQYYLDYVSEAEHLK